MEEVQDWIQGNLATPAVSHFVDVKGASIHYRRWGNADRAKPGILLIHGMWAHSHWWDAIAPALLDSHHVVAMDWSGAGDSDHKEVYPAGDAAAEATAVCEDAGFGRNAFLVSHSAGVSIALLAALQSRGHYRGSIGIDPPAGERDRAREEPRYRELRLFETRADAVANFRPKDAIRNPCLLEHIAQRSVIQTDKGWTWKADRNWAARFTQEGAIQPDFERLSDQMSCPFAAILGRESRFYSPPLQEHYLKLFGRDNVVTIEEAGHHGYLDQPRAVVRGLTEILDRWSE